MRAAKVKVMRLQPELDQLLQEESERVVLLQNFLFSRVEYLSTR